jgi:hypothetical protein
MPASKRKLLISFLMIGTYIIHLCISVKKLLMKCGKKDSAKPVINV